jgi:hypothetical protein
MKGDKIYVTCSIPEATRHAYTILIGNLKRWFPFGLMGADGNIILNWIFKKHGVRKWIVFN